MKDENIEVTDADVDAEVKELAAQYGMDEGAVRAAVSVEMLKNDISMKKALALITDSAVRSLIFKLFKNNLGNRIVLFLAHRQILLVNQI